MSAINIAAILALREGATGDALADHEIRSIERYIKGTSYATAAPADRMAFENGMLRSALRKVCNLLDEAVQDPEPMPTLDDLQAFEAEWSVDAEIARWVELAAAQRMAVGHAA